MSNVRVFIQFQLVMIISAPSFRKIESGRRLTKKASLTAVLTLVSAQLGAFGLGVRVVRTG